jgi:predicted transposase YdaD
MAERIDQEPPPRSRELWASVGILMGLCYPKAAVRQITEGVRTMIDLRDSSFYEILKEEIEPPAFARGEAKGKLEGRIEGKLEGKLEGIRRALLLMGEIRLGRPDPSTLAGIEAIASVEELERLSRRLLQVSSWRELLAEPAKPA